MRNFPRPRSARKWRPLLLALVLCLPLAAQEVAAPVGRPDTDPVHLLEQSRFVSEKEAKKLRQRVQEFLRRRKQDADPADQERFAKRFVEALPRTIRTPVELRDVLGPPRTTSRQILYRRLVEQWHYDRPVPLCAVFDTLWGQEPRLQTVQLAGLSKP